MPDTPYELAEAFPDLADLMTDLNHSNTHFAKMSAVYHSISENILYAEDHPHLVNLEYTEVLRRTLSKLETQIYAFTKSYEAGLVMA